MTDTKYLKRSKVWFPHYVGRRVPIKRKSLNFEERKKFNIDAKCNYIPPPLMSPDMSSAIVVHRGRNSINAARILRLKLINRIPNSFYINVTDMKNSDNIAIALGSVGMNPNTISLEDIYNVIKEYKSTVKSVSDYSSLSVINNTINSLTSNINALPRVDIWGYLLLAIASYLFYPSNNLSNYPYMSTCHLLLYLIIANGIIDIYAETIESMLNIYSAYQNENKEDKVDVYSMLLDIANGTPNSANIFVDYHNTKETNLGSYNDARKYWYEDCKRVIHYDYEEEMDNSSASIERVRKTIIDRQSFNNISDIFLNRFERGDIILNNIYGGLVSDANDALSNKSSNWLEHRGGKRQGDESPLSCIFNVLMDETGICSSLNSLQNTLNRTMNLGNILDLGNITDKLNGLELPGNFINLLGDPKSLLKSIVITQLQKIVRQVRNKLSNSILGLDVDNTLLNCFGWEKILNEANNITRNTMNAWDNNLSTLSNGDKSIFNAGDKLLEAINKSDAMINVSSFLDGVKDSLGSIISNIEMGICDKDTVDSIIHNIIQLHTKDNSDIFDTPVIDDVSVSDSIFGDNLPPIAPINTGNRVFDEDIILPDGATNSDANVSINGDAQLSEIEESRVSLDDVRALRYTESLIVLWRT